jgi:hypothetical protein
MSRVPTCFRVGDFRSHQFRTERDRPVGHAKRDFAAFGVEAGHQAFELERTDLLFREVHHRDHELSNQIRWLVKMRDLCARLFHADLVAEVDVEHVSRLSRLREVLGADDAAYPQFDFGEGSRGRDST